MKIALIGYGKIGRLIEEIAVTKGHQITVKIDSRSALALLTHEGLSEADVCIDFSHPSCVFDNIKKILEIGKPLVVGTTGWYERLPEVKSLVSEHSGSFLYAPNFSVGVMLFMRLAEHAAHLMDRFDEYDAGIFESHHREKKDAPSGTAVALAQILLKQLKRKTSVVYDLMDREIAPGELHVASLRCGQDPGTHTIMFDGATDMVHLTHRARSRTGFAQGAITAAEWVRHRKGFFSLEDMLTAL